MGEEDRRYLAQALDTLPPELRTALLEPLASTPPTVRYGDELKFFQNFELSSAPALALFLAHEQFGGAAAICLWRWDAGKAMRLLGQKRKRSALEQNNLLDTGPADWARKHLPTAGRDAECLAAIVKTVQSSE